MYLIMEDPVEKTVEETVEETVEDTIKEVKDEDDVKLAAKKLTDSDAYTGSDTNKENSDNQEGAKDPMSPENITKHEPTAVNRVQYNQLVEEGQAGSATQDAKVAIPFNNNETIDWEKVIKKEARGLDDYDLGEVQEVNGDIVITKKGVVDKDKFYLPRSNALRFDGNKLWFEVSKEEAKAYKQD